ncbi:hypothetical protein DFH08DRAFT_808616 [Mycena albidolilacea]|uniref:Uncharacterized protein n=1 Tax=Mycena albidolilacea TaxID=1033008 RepID=A0AAD7A1R1_9AGAR|nr:hypothetical protein DFH08DRAFT_808616 [Mycena albidolilacea]
MCDTSHILQSSTWLWTLSLIPNSILPYLVLGVMSTSIVTYALGHSLPSARLDRLNEVFTVVEELLNHAKKCMRDYLVLAETETRFLRTKLAVSKLHSRLLETRNMRGWKDYLHNMIAILRGLAMLECEMQDIRTSLLVLIEAAHQRKLTQDIHESQEIVDGALHPQYSSCGRAHSECTAANYEV